MKTRIATSTDAAMSEATRTSMLPATGLLLVEALGTFRGTRKTSDRIREGNTEHCT